MLDQEGRALLARLARVKPFVLSQPMLLAASLLPAAQIAIERFLAKGRRELKERVQDFLSWLHGEGEQASPQDIQRRFVFLKLRFNAVLSQLELFHQVISQRSENEQGVWLSGLDVVAADALALPEYYEVPPVICYLDRGIGGAIRRAGTRLPGGGENQVAVIRVPRERMIRSGKGWRAFGSPTTRLPISTTSAGTCLPGCKKAFRNSSRSSSIIARAPWAGARCAKR